MTSGNRESRFEELRRRARERLTEVRDNIEREMGASVPKDQTPSPDRLEDIFIPPQVTRPPVAVTEPETFEEKSARGNRLGSNELPSHRIVIRRLLQSPDLTLWLPPSQRPLLQ